MTGEQEQKSNTALLSQTTKIMLRPNECKAKTNLESTYNRPSNKVPRKVLRILVLSRRHICLLVVTLHSLVLAESLDQSQQRVDQTRPLRADTGIGWKRSDGQVAGCELGVVAIKCHIRAMSLNQTSPHEQSRPQAHGRKIRVQNEIDLFSLLHIPVNKPTPSYHS
jgi:hypothetical protein